MLLSFRAPRFKGYQQQDSQELLHYLLDSIRVEETKVRINTTHTLKTTEMRTRNYLGEQMILFSLVVIGVHLMQKSELCTDPVQSGPLF